MNACPRCDLERKETLLQQMADIKEQQLNLALPWSMHRNGLIIEAIMKFMKKRLAFAMFPGAMLTYA